MIERSKKFILRGREFFVKFPNVGQLIDLESLKQALTNGRYGIMASSGIASMYRALDMVDAIAFFQVCAPNIARQLDIRSYTEMDVDGAQDFLTLYTEQIRPWLDGVMGELKSVKVGGEEKDGAAKDQGLSSEKEG